MEQIRLKQEEYSYEMTEEIKTLRTNIEFAGKNKKVILVTSCIQGEGKSSAALRLAASLAELKKRVLFVDTDLRASVLLGKVQSDITIRGLSHYLSGQSELSEVVYKTTIKNLDMILAGPVPPNPTELLAAKEFSEMIQDAKKAYDYVIVDSAPLGMVIDAAIVAKNCDASILVIESAGIKYRFAQDVKKQLEDTGCSIVGVVLTRVKKNKSGRYYGRYYEKKAWKKAGKQSASYK